VILDVLQNEPDWSGYAPETDNTKLIQKIYTRDDLDVPHGSILNSISTGLRSIPTNFESKIIDASYQEYMVFKDWWYDTSFTQKVDVWILLSGVSTLDLAALRIVKTSLLVSDARCCFK